ncbi:CDP-diacylglycerol--serine O-phosphatidyltransferase [Granulicella cerasi]|uniref:CDP-diacylglycerol--serine O-phosphatidyltransferase n=1 Tax=Granulicella cerasi TaxID=741063 RepID=A0ABW1Z4M6_9BACT|nr:CDP-diacylglycerol--serine O-phosphatidyltransferase [Granulicella cerasi]
MADVEMTPTGKRPSRGMYILPSLFTAGNIAAGYFALMQAIRGSAMHDPAAFDRSALAIAFAIVFDGLDGRIARMTNTQSDFGKELDSLADVIAFGVAPSVLAYLWGVHQVLPLGNPSSEAHLSHFGIVVCFLFLICGACRLARFNVSVNPQPRNPGRPGRKYFVGMPIPAGAGCVAAVVHFENGSPIYSFWWSLVWLVLVACVGFLMVSSWRFWSGKEIDVSSRRPARLLILLMVVLAVLYEWSEIGLLALAMTYLVSGVVARVAYSFGSKPQPTA